MPHGSRVEVGVLVGVVVLAGCGEPRISDGPWQAIVSHLGDTTVIHTVSGSVWEEPARLVEEVRIGTMEEGETTSFGVSGEVAVADDG